MNLESSKVKRGKKTKQPVFTVPRMERPECTHIQTKLEVAVLKKKCLKNTMV